jgi:penicillin-binding protein 1C
VGAYSSLARRGMAGAPRFTPDAGMNERRMMSEGAAFIVRDILESGGPSARAANTSAGPQRGIAWKTGTSFGFRDAWAIGVSNRYTVGVWVGRPDGTPNPGFFGANVAAPLLVDVFSLLPEDGRTAPRMPPANVAQEKICWPLGGRYAPDNAALCSVQRTAWTLNGAAPPTFPDKLRPGSPRYEYTVDARSGLRVLPDCAGGATQTREAVRWPTLLEPWLEASLQREARPPAWSPACHDHREASAAIKIVGLNNGSVIQQANGAKPPVVRLELRGGGEGLRGPVHWIVNGRVVAHGTGSQPLQFDEPGRYDITALDQQGRHNRISISVRATGMKKPDA